MQCTKCFRERSEVSLRPFALVNPSTGEVMRFEVEVCKGCSYEIEGILNFVRYQWEVRRRAIQSVSQSAFSVVERPSTPGGDIPPDSRARGPGNAPKRGVGEASRKEAPLPP